MKVHFISIGGSVMHQLAIALKRKGYEVSGTDDEIFEPAKSNLEREGLLPQKEGWDVSKITQDIDAVILGMHAKADNPEMLRAKEMGLKIYSFPEYIYQESINKTRIVVGGSHGKTTTTSMIMHVLKQCGKDFDYLVGAKLEGFDQSVKITDAPLIVCEGDEYPASVLEKRPKFHFLYPQVAIITGIAWDHINVFPTFEIYVKQFEIFIEKIEEQGILIYNETDEQLNKLIAAMQRDGKLNRIQLQPYSVPEHHIFNGTTTVILEGEETTLKVFGDHNLLNLHAAFFACKRAGIQARQFAAAISTFKGASKRLELLAANDNTNLFRDFAHAPSKVKATIEAVKQQFPERKLFAILELHTYSSLNEQFLQEYQGSLNKADVAVVFYSNHALELKRMPALPAEKVIAGFQKQGLLVFNSAEHLSDYLHEQDFQNSNVVFMSSGNYDGMDIATFAKEITHNDN